jgi:pimeloyl-ACP methyl ester carboxylesterase
MNFGLPFAILYNCPHSTSDTTPSTRKKEQEQAMNAWTDGYVQANGIRLHYYRTGGDVGDDKAPLLLAHGITGNGLCWSRLARALEDAFDLIMVDARGHGLSDKPEKGYGPHDHAADLASIIQVLGLGQTAVLGHSMGGASAAIMAATHPELVNRLILEDPAWFPPDPAAPQEDEAAAHQRRREWEERIAWRKTLSLEEVTAATRRENPLWTDEEFPAHSEAKHQVSPNVVQFIHEPVQRWWEVVPQLRCPTLVLTGDTARGVVITESMAEKIPTLTPHIEVVRLAGAGHNVRREQFDLFVHHVRRFLGASQPI